MTQSPTSNCLDQEKLHGGVSHFVPEYPSLHSHSQSGVKPLAVPFLPQSASVHAKKQYFLLVVNKICIMNEEKQKLSFVSNYYK